jgi:hypothetical protein
MGVYDADTSDNFSSDADVVNLGSDATPSGWVLTKKDSSGANLAIQHSGNIANVASDLDLSSDMPFVNIHWVFAAGGSSDSSDGNTSNSYMLDENAASIVATAKSKGMYSYALEFTDETWNYDDFTYEWQDNRTGSVTYPNNYVLGDVLFNTDEGVTLLSCTVTENNDSSNTYTYTIEISNGRPATLVN